MKNNKIIIYDDNCPLCSAYTRAFVLAGMIEKENRKNFSTIDPAIINLVDTSRCSNEIPVVDIQTKQVWYGIDAMIEILQTKIPLAKKIVQIKFAKWILNRFYKLISFNRRVIAAVKNKAGNFDCTPDFNFGYRMVFMSFFLVFNTAMLIPIHTYILENSFISISHIQLQSAHLLLVISNIIIAFGLKPKPAFEYLGQVNMLALTTVLITIPLLLLNKYHLIKSTGINNYFLLFLTIFVFKEYKRRMSFAGIPENHPHVVILNILGLIAFILYMVY